jgi:hypothetical protein
MVLDQPPLVSLATCFPAPVKIMIRELSKIREGIPTKV